MLGDCYASGQGLPLNYAQAAHWYRKAAEQGSRLAQWELGRCYEKGKGVPKDVTAAWMWFKLAAEQNSALAKNDLAVLSALLSPAELIESQRLYAEHSKRKHL